MKEELEARIKKLEKALRILIRIYVVPDEYKMDEKAAAVERYFKKYVGD